MGTLGASREAPGVVGVCDRVSWQLQVEERLLRYHQGERQTSLPKSHCGKYLLPVPPGLKFIVNSSFPVTLRIIIYITGVSQVISI